MGRNAQKRRERRQKRVQEALREREQAQVQRLAAEEVEEAPEPRPVWEEALGVALDRPLDEAGLDRLLFHVAAGLAAGSGDMRERLRPVTRQVAHWLPADTVTVAVEAAAFDEQAPRGEPSLTVAAMHARHEGDQRALADLLAAPFFAALIDAGEVVRVDDVPRDGRFAHIYGQRSHVGSLMIVPFYVATTDHGPRGVLLVTRKEVRGFPITADHLLSRLGIAIGRDLARVAQLRAVFLCPTTGLRSRAGLLVDLPLWIARARRRGDAMSAMMLEVRNLRAVRDAYGADAERIVLRALGDRLREQSRFADAVTRFGRASFVLIAPSSLADTEPGAARLLEVLGAPISIGDVLIELELRSGVAELGPDDDAFELLAAAEAAMVVRT